MFANCLSHMALFAILIMASSFGLAASSIWANEELGVCYPTVDSFMETTYGSDCSQDENIKIFPAPGTIEGRYMIAVDDTPSINQTHYLLDNSSGQVCVVLFAPFSSSFELNLKKDGSLPEKIKTSSTAPAGHSSFEVIFNLDRKKNIYRPYKCRSVKYNGKKEEIKVINCENSFQGL